MKVLLTGGTGFIGSRLRPALAARGHEVKVVSRKPGADFDWTAESIRRGVRETDAIVHLAGEGIADRRWRFGPSVSRQDEEATVLLITLPI